MPGFKPSNVNTTDGLSQYDLCFRKRKYNHLLFDHRHLRQGQLGQITMKPILSDLLGRVTIRFENITSRIIGKRLK